MIKTFPFTAQIPRRDGLPHLVQIGSPTEFAVTKFFADFLRLAIYPSTARYLFSASAHNSVFLNSLKSFSLFNLNIDFGLELAHIDKIGYGEV